jgi:serine/threonine protein kinase
MPFASGARLGPYEIVSPLGVGGMGEVYKARDTRLDRTVAIKVLPSAVAGDPDFRARFEREARAIAALDHPHICALHDVGEHNGIHDLAGADRRRVQLDGRTRRVTVTRFVACARD